jgi:hypothetical protein
MYKTSILSICILLSACTVSPQIAPQQTHRNCDLITRELTLDYQWLPHDIYKVNCTNRIEVCLGASLATAGLWTVGSTLVSGSIYLTGNSLHWLEYQGRCEDSELRNAIQRMQEMLELQKDDVIPLPDSTLPQHAPEELSH